MLIVGRGFRLWKWVVTDGSSSHDEWGGSVIDGWEYMSFKNGFQRGDEKKERVGKDKQ